MKIFVAFLISFLHTIVALPLDYDQIVFPDGNKIDELVKKSKMTKFDSRSLLDDPNILKSKNTTEKFFFDKKADSKLEYGSHFQGDIVLQHDQKQFFNKSSENAKIQIGTRTGLIWEGYRWPKNEIGRVVLPYIISNDFCEY